MKANRLAPALSICLACAPSASAPPAQTPEQTPEQTPTPEVVEDSQAPMTDNTELVAMVEADQADRQSDTEDWGPIAERDRQRRARVIELDEAGDLRTANDYAGAALIFQHGETPADYERANHYAGQARELDPDNAMAAWLWAATMDRWLQSQGEAQIYGTQHRMGDDGQWTLEPIDRAAVSDEERAALGVPPLAEADARNLELNASSSE